ncbi:MAG: DUF4124 domain-containing protein [Acidovorax sp.]|nr:DUF4124 domain-containing protein [Acidovorax sp.]
MQWIIPIAAAVALFSGIAHAQVHKCKGAAGNTVYSDQPCDSKSVGGLIERKRTQDEIYVEREKAYEAEMLKRQRNMAEQQRELAEQQRQPIQAPAVRHSGNDWARRKELENAATSAGSITNNGGRWDRAAEAQRARERLEAVRAEQQRRATSPYTSTLMCNKGTCTDTEGNSYTSNGGFMNRSDGRVCTATGSMVNCN